MKNKKFSEWILPIASTIIALMLIAIFTAISTFLGKFESKMLNLHSEQAKQVLALQVKQGEFQKEIEQNYKRSKENKDQGDKRYGEINEKIGCINVSIGQVKTTQLHTLKEIEKIHNTFDRLLGYSKVVNSKGG